MNTVVMDGVGTSAFLGQNMRPDGDPIFFEVSEFKRSIDLLKSRARQEATLQPRFSAAVPQTQKQILGLDADVAFNVGAGVRQPVSPIGRPKTAAPSSSGTIRSTLFGPRSTRERDCRMLS